MDQTTHQSSAVSPDESPSFWRRVLMNEFIVSLSERLTALRMSHAAFAKKLGVSDAYVSKVFNGDTNLTIASIVKLTMAIGGAVHIHVSGSDAIVVWKEYPDHEAYTLDTPRWNLPASQTGTTEPAHPQANAPIPNLSLVAGSFRKTLAVLHTAVQPQFAPPVTIGYEKLETGPQLGAVYLGTHQPSQMEPWRAHGR